MRQSPELDRVQARMRPGEITLNGFLGNDGRRLVDILAADAETLARLGIPAARIADRLHEIAEKGRTLMEETVPVETRYRVRVRDDRGLLPSPWGDGRFCKGDVEMADTATSHAFRWNELTLHMIRAHGFFGGLGGEYRIDPAAAVKALGLHPGSEPLPEAPTPGDPA